MIYFECACVLLCVNVDRLKFKLFKKKLFTKIGRRSLIIMIYDGVNSEKFCLINLTTMKSS